MSSQIGIMGGSFDPPHLGHLSIARSFANSSHVDELWIIPTPVPPHKNSEDLTDFDHRYRMAHKNFGSESNIAVYDFERNLPAPHYTYETLSALSKQFPHHTFKLCIGQDSLQSIKQWHKWEQILSEYELLVARRPGYGSDISRNKENVVYIEHDPHPASATKIRDVLNSGRIPEEYLSEKVSTYIKENNLYL